MNKNIENIQKNLEVIHFSIIPDGTLHSHNYIEVELIEEGNGTQIINGQYFNICKRSISILRPYIDNQSIIPQNTAIFDHNISFLQNKNYAVHCGSIRIISGDNAQKYYTFLAINGKIIAEEFLTDDFHCEKVSFFTNYSTRNIHISENNFDIDFSQSKILSNNDTFSYYDYSSNIDLDLPENFVLKKDDLTRYDLKKSEQNTFGSFIYSCYINIEAIGYRLLTFKLIGKGREINFLLTTDKVFIAQILSQNEFSIYKLCINPNLLSVDTRKKLLSFNTPLCLKLNEECYENIKRVFELLIHFYKQDNAPDTTVLNIVDILFRLYFDETIKSLKVNPFKEKILMYFIDNNNFLNDITLEDFSNYLGYDSGYASRLCQKVTGYSFVKYKIYLRLQYAKHLIVSTNISISEISIKSGFNSLSVFNRFFKKEVGVSPSEYRSLHIK